MQTTKAAWLLLVVPSLALAGCSEDPADTDSGGPGVPANFDEFELKASETTGILRGVVIDEAIRPLGDVLVNVVKPGGGNLTMETEDDGLFGFDGLDPGTYFITAAKDGFVAVQASGEVVAGDADPDPIKIMLLRDPANAPYIQQEHLDGFVTCSIRPMFIAAQCPGAGGNIVNENYEMPRKPSWIQSEMTWDSTQATGDELSLVINCLPDRDPAERCQEGQMTIVRDEGFSPRMVTINETTAANWTLGGPEGNPLSVSIFVFGRSDLDVWDEDVIYDAQKPATGNDCLHWPQVGGYPFAPGTCMRATGPGLVVNQKVDIYTHIFFGFTPNEGWSFIDDGEHAVPDS